jgi:hypothetical protein
METQGTRVKAKAVKVEARRIRRRRGLGLIVSAGHA